MNLSIAILSRTERFLNKTIQSILDNVTGEVEIFTVLDGYGDTPYEPIIDPRVKYISLPNNGQLQKRQGINTAVSISKGEYVMWCDAHCAFGKGFDEILTKDCEDRMVVVPRRSRMNVDNWTGTNWNKPPIDYEYFMWQFLRKGRIAAYKWDIKTLARMDVPIDDIMTMQGSCVVMKRSWFDKCGFMKVEGYTGWGQEGEELCLTTMLNGGRAVVNKNTWYSHLHKGATYGRMYHWTKNDIYPSYDYSFNYWINEQKDFFISVIEKFWPIPNFPENWKEKLWKSV
jgi:glycosyltransferase involved in cell wall biosynthesis